MEKPADSLRLQAIQNKCKRWIAEQALIPPGSTVLAAFSGGADSAAMLLLLSALSAELDISVRAAHINHQLRGEDAARDAAFCAAFCARRGIPFHLASGDAAAAAKQRKKGTEDAARHIRYALLSAIAEECGAARIATAHNAEDHLETVLLQLTRGTAGKGLCGIAPENGAVIRPVLPLRREETEYVVHAFGEQYVVDATNADPRFARNRIRCEVIPVLRAVNPGVTETVLANSLLLRETLERGTAEPGMNAALSAHNRTMHPLSVQGEEIRMQLAAHGITPDRKKIAAVLRIAQSGNPSARADMGGGWIYRREYDALYLEKKTDAAAHAPFCIPLPRGGTTVLNARYAVTVTPCAHAPHGWAENEKNPAEVYKKFNHFYINHATIQDTICIRTRQPEDQFRKNEKSGTKALRRVLIDLKIPQTLRSDLPVIADAQGVLWVYGVGAHAERLQNPALPGYLVSVQTVQTGADQV